MYLLSYDKKHVVETDHLFARTVVEKVDGVHKVVGYAVFDVKHNVQMSKTYVTEAEAIEALESSLNHSFLTMK